jgi:predicted DNA-binding protein (MmcQ/YjbR family)
MPNARLDYPFGASVAVYKIDDSMFALISEGKNPVQLSLKCDPELSKVLRAKYDEIMPGYHLNKQHWNTMVLTGQLPWEEVQGLIRHSYDLVASHTD